MTSTNFKYWFLIAGYIYGRFIIMQVLWRVETNYFCKLEIHNVWKCAQFNSIIMCYAQFTSEIAPSYLSTQENVPTKLLSLSSQLVITLY